MADRRRKDINWTVADEKGDIYSWNAAQVAVLMDIRDDLKRLNNVLQCPNFIEVPSILREIRRNTRKRRKAKAIGKPKLRVVR